MTDPLATPVLLGEDIPDPVQLVMNWLAPLADSLAQVGMIRREDSPLPYWQVGIIHAEDIPWQGTAEADVSVHYMTDARGGVDADTIAIRGGAVLHLRMMSLARNPEQDIIIRGRAVNVDWLETVERPAWRDYDDTTISRVKAVYRLGLSFTAT